MELLNLDELAPIERRVVLGGKEYKLANQTVGQMISAVRLAEKTKSEGEENMLEATLEAAKQLLPDAPEVTIKALSIKQIVKLMNFATASDEEAAEVSKKTEK